MHFKNSPQVHDQRLHPVQETGNGKEESLLSIQQTSVDNSMDVMIGSSRLVMDNGNSPAESTVTFTRPTRRLVFEFLGGHARMEELPCLGDLEDGNDEFHRTTPIPMELLSESSQVKFLDPILLDTYEAPSTESIVSLEHSSQRTDKIELLPENSINAHFICNNSAIDILKLDHPTPIMPFQQCDLTGKFVLSTIDAGSNYDSLDSNIVPDTIFKNLAFKLQKIGVNRTTEIQEYDLHKHALTSENFESQFHLHHKNLEDFPVSSNFSTEERKNGSTNNGNTFSIPNSGTLMDYLYGDLENPQFLDEESSAMQSESLCCTIGNDGEGPTFSVPDRLQLMNFLYGDLESPLFISSESIEEEVPIYAEYDGNDSKVNRISWSADDTIGESYQCSSISVMVTPETIAVLMTESLSDSNGFTKGMDFKMGRISSSSQVGEESSKISDSKLSYQQDDLNVADCFDKFTSKLHNTSATEPERSFPKNPTTFVPYESEDYKENMTTDSSPCTSATDQQSLINMNSVRNSYENPEIYVSSLCCDQKVCLLGDYGSDDDVEVADLSDCTLNVLFSRLRTYNTPNLPIESKNGSLTEAFEGNEVAPTSSVSIECNGERISSDSSFFDLSNHDDLLEVYGLNIQNQYTDVGYTCESPSWPGKPEGQLQESPTCLIPNLTKDDNANGTLTADSSLFHYNTDETSVMNKKLTSQSFVENLENSVSLRCLNQMECAFETSSIHYDFGSTDCVHPCRDDFGDSIEHQSLKNDENELKFAFPDPSTLKDYFFGSLDSPQFLASELLNGEIDNLHYPSLFGEFELDHSTDEADLSDKMIFDHCYEFINDVSSINKFSCSVEFPDVSSSSFDISDHGKLLERQNRVKWVQIGMNETIRTEQVEIKPSGQNQAGQKISEAGRIFSIFIMNTAQLHDQHLRPAQETGNEKAMSLLSIHQTLIDHSMDVVIDSSRLVTDNGIFPVGSTEDMFARLNQRMVFEFLGGHARMEELPCFGDLTNGNYEVYRTFPIPMEPYSESSQIKFLDPILLDTFDAFSTASISSLEHFSQSTDEIELLPKNVFNAHRGSKADEISQSAGHTIEESHQCSPLDSFMIPETISGLMAESLCDSEASETQVFMKSGGFSNGIDLMSAPIPILSNQSDKENSETPVSVIVFPEDGANIFDMTVRDSSETYNVSVNAPSGHVQKTLGHFAPEVYPMISKNRLENVPIKQAVQTSNSSTSDGDSVSAMDCILLGHPCIDKIGDSNKLPTISTDETSPKFSIPDPKHLCEFLYGTLKFARFLASELPDEKLDTFDYPSLHEGSDSVDDRDVADLSDNKFNTQFIGVFRNYDKKTSDIPGVLIGLDNCSPSGDCEEIEVSVTLKISDPGYIESLGTYWPTGVVSSSFDVNDQEELLENYGFNNQDQTIDVGYTCTSPTWPGKVDGAWKEAIQMNLTDLASNKHSLNSFYDENFKNSVSSTDLEQRECAFNTSSSPYSSEDYLSQGHPCSNGFENSMGETILGTTENQLVYSIPDPDTLGNFLFGNLTSPTFLASELQDIKFDILDSSFGASFSDYCKDVESLSDNCNLELLDSDSTCKDPSAFPFEFSDHYELLESYGLNEQDQYTDDFICKSPTWPGKV